MGTICNGCGKAVENEKTAKFNDLDLCEECHRAFSQMDMIKDAAVDTLSEMILGKPTGEAIRAAGITREDIKNRLGTMLR